MAGYRDPIVAAVTAVDADLDPDAIRAVVERVTPHREQRRLLATAVSSDHGWFAGSVTAPVSVERLVTGLVGLGSGRFEPPRCGTCGRVSHCVGRAPDGTRLCKACDHRRRTAECVSCGRHRPVGGHLGGGAVCATCYRTHPDRLEECIDCGERRIMHRRHPHGGAICPRCYMRRARALDDVPGTIGVCVDCGRDGFCIGVSTGEPRCARCYPQRRAPCVGCGRTKRVAVVWAAGEHCDSCRIQVLNSAGTCEACGQARRIDPRNDNGRQLCSPCAGLEAMSTCGACGSEARLWERDRCVACTLERRLDTLFTAGRPNLAERLAPLRTTLLAHSRDRAALDWLCRSGSGRLLRQVFDGGVDLSHDGLDQVGTRVADHLRHVLVTTGVLDERDEQLARLERWLAGRLASIEDRDDRHLVETYATWHVLRRRRQRAARTRSSGATTSARRNIAAAIALLEWLRHHGRPFAELTQADIDLWVTTGPPQRRSARAFLSWAASRKLIPRVTVLVRPHQLPSSTITASQLRAFVHRLATDSSIPAVERVAGLLVALYGQPATRLVRLRVDHITINADEVTLQLGRHHVELPPVLAGLVAELVTDRRQRGLAAPAVSPWLFPGGHPGRPLTANWLAARITTHGLPVAELRAAALLELATELPAAFLADLLGISAGTAVRWTHAAGGEWARYAATRARTTSQ